MKKILAMLTLFALCTFAAVAQPGYGYGHGRGYGYGQPRGGRGYYGRYGTEWYGGVKFGVTGSHVSSQSSELNGNGVETGISLGLAAGFNIAPAAAFESGIYYTEKGGSSRNADGRFTYDLNYLEVPLLLKYYIYSGNRAVVQPYIGAYLGLGVGGQIKDYGTRSVTDSFGSGLFRRGDSGLALGCGISWSFLYASLGYEYGLANIGADLFSETHNRALVFSVGFAF